jgi:hypothetical protein
MQLYFVCPEGKMISKKWVAVFGNQCFPSGKSGHGTLRIFSRPKWLILLIHLQNVFVKWLILLFHLQNVFVNIKKLALKVNNCQIGVALLRRSTRCNKWFYVMNSYPLGTLLSQLNCYSVSPGIAISIFLLGDLYWLCGEFDFLTENLLLMSWTIFYFEKNRYFGLCDMKKSLFRPNLKIYKYFWLSAKRLLSKISN